MINYLPIVIVLIVAIIGGIISNKNLPWFYSSNVVRSPHTPPGYIFGIVWSVIYIAFAYVWIKSSKQLGNTFFIISIILNLLWTVVFFGFHNFILSRFIIIALLAVTLYQAYQLWKIKDTVGAFLMLVYSSWIICATGLNFETHLK